MGSSNCGSFATITMELSNDLQALLANTKLKGIEPERKSTASSNQVTAQLRLTQSKGSGHYILEF